MNRKSLLPAVTLAALVAASCWFGMYRGSFAAKQARFQNVADQIEKGTLPANRFGIVTLAPRWAALTADGNVYVTNGPGNQKVELFCTWRGKGSDLWGYLHSTSPLTVPSTLRISIPFPSNTSPAVVSDVQIRSLAAPGWYWVSGRNDG